MPKPTFFQTVLRKPTRSYADPYAPSPWADYPADPPSEDDYHEYPSTHYPASDFGDGYEGYASEEVDEAGPSDPRSLRSLSSGGSRMSEVQSRANRIKNADWSYNNGVEEAENRRPRKSKSTVSLGDNAQSMIATRFPKPVKTSSSSVAVRSGGIVEVNSQLPNARRKKKVTIASVP